MDAELLNEIRGREWFYRFELPDGSTTASYLPEAARSVHETRLTMVREKLDPLLASGPMTALDLGSHQGWFSVELAKMGCSRVTGVEPRATHVHDARLMTRALGLESRLEFVHSSIDELPGIGIEPADIVLMLGLIYHLENPVGAIRTAHAHCRKVCLIETQVGPHLSGMLDWGSSEFVRPIQGCFTVIDETDETHGPETGTQGICLAPSVETLVWIMRKVGFRDVGLVEPPADGYEQHRHGKRVLAVGIR